MHQRIRVALATAAAAALTGGLLTAAAGPASAAGAAKAYDFNGDGYRDLVVGVPGGTANGFKAAGYLAVIPGSKTGLKPTERSIVSQSTGSVPGASETGDHFGARWSSADLNRDGRADLIVSAPGEAGSNGVRHGRITILWGSASGLTTGTPLPPLAADIRGLGNGGLFPADVNGDGVTDLVTMNVGGDGDQQTVTVTPGPFKPGTPAPVAHEVYRDYLLEPHGTVGDFDGDGTTDLALDEIGYQRGTPSGLTPEPSWPVTDVNASAYASGDFDHDGYDDIAFGAADATTGPAVKGGFVRVVYGGPTGPSRTAYFSQASSGVPGTDENGDLFGYSVSAADVNGDGYADLAVGAPYEDIDSVANAGSVTLLYGSATGITGKGAAFHQGTAGVSGSNETNDHFGGAVWLRDINGDGRADLFASATNEDNGNGRVWNLRGTASGITTSGSITVDATSLKLPPPVSGLSFGSGLGR
ncbi:FG-GAP and VCBS repeat-containing protein [Streptomyces sp. NPDC060188]|uniref:FG-GAP and VCBS repeat-containing protein n=1 Tax=Streptomyces sp. NPDC060188 TaxID=3347068 RepID=UPI0036472069